MEKIDIHCHATPRKIEMLGGQSADITTIENEMEYANVVFTVLLASYFPQKGTGISNYRLRNWITNKNNFAMFGSLDMEVYFYQGLNELEELAEQYRIRGIKLYTGYQQIDLKGERARMVARLAARHDLPLMFHTGYAHGSTANNGVPAYTDLVKASDLEHFTDYTKVIVAHLGKPNIEDTIEVLQRNRRMYTDTSGLFRSYDEKHEMPLAIDELRKVFESCGTKQILFGTDFPVTRHTDAISVVATALEGFSSAENEEVWRDNAARIIGFPRERELDYTGLEK